MEDVMKLEGHMNNGYKVGGYSYLKMEENDGDNGCNFLV